MDTRTLGAVLAVGSVSCFYVAWRFWNLRLATPRPGTKFAAMSSQQRRERLRSVATNLVALGAAMLGFGIWLWMRSGG